MESIRESSSSGTHQAKILFLGHLPLSKVLREESMTEEMKESEERHLGFAEWVLMIFPMGWKRQLVNL